jgi:hypothetical protein
MVENSAIERVVRESYGRLLAFLTLIFYSLGMRSARKPLISLKTAVKYFKM